MRSRDIKVNGARADGNIMLATGDEVTYYTTAAEEAKPSHTVAYEDQNVLVADKFSGVSTEALCTELGEDGEVYAVHRIDRNTAGLIVFAKTSAAETELLRAFKNRGVIKNYLAVCKNRFKRDSGTLEAYLGKNALSSTVNIYPNPKRGTERIVTEYRVIEKRGDLALVEITLHTGKTHQIRAHMAHIGCPVLGDNKYGDRDLNRKYSLARQRLLAVRLEFVALGGEIEYLNGLNIQSGQKLSLDMFKN